MPASEKCQATTPQMMQLQPPIDEAIQQQVHKLSLQPITSQHKCVTCFKHFVRTQSHATTSDYSTHR